jgi:hypothetical protein
MEPSVTAALVAGLAYAILASSVVELRAQAPAPGAHITERFPHITAEFTHVVSPRSVHLWLDGNDVTERGRVSSAGFSITPAAALQSGSHTVRVTGNDVTGASFSREWSFAVIHSNATEIHLTISEPVSDARVGRRFLVQGNTIANGVIRVTAGLRSGANGQFSGDTTADAHGNFQMNVVLRTLRGQLAVNVRVTATDPVTSRSTSTTLQLRLSQ